MPNWKCPADLFSFCNGTPDWEVEPKSYTMQDGNQGAMVGGKCKLDKDTCGKLLKYSEVVKENPALKKASLVMKVIPIGKEKDRDKEEKVKAKGAKAKKLEQEMIQGSFL